MISPYDPKVPHFMQVDLDFICPEIQLQADLYNKGKNKRSKEKEPNKEPSGSYAVMSSVCGGFSFAGDIFSFGIFITSLFNNGESLISCNGDAEIYAHLINQVYIYFSIFNWK